MGVRCYNGSSVPEIQLSDLSNPCNGLDLTNCPGNNTMLELDKVGDAVPPGELHATPLELGPSIERKEWA